MAASRPRVRKSPEYRRQQIIDAAVRLIGVNGFNGTSLKDIADEVGLTQAGLLHYVDSKEGVLSLVITDVYDVEGSPDEFLRSGLPGSDPQAPHFPAYLRYLVRCNEARRPLSQMFTVLQTEALSPTHPLHDMFAHRPEDVWDQYSQYPWALPEVVGGWELGMRPIVRRCIAMMDGLQLRWLRDPPIVLSDEWAAFEQMIFPSPLWDPYR
ncbi:MAG: helix-turn-helix domain-containing protein [Actinomycetaceae bacterium]|nr:helix-turn-helix domain-containing protein [Actinomycetaceae bacterium]MDU0971216.1 helix-turn-helix domain-containing protein [Actinomycetaceae bacterium]